jgi:inhibitor of Bruton tyrosine kinase
MQRSDIDIELRDSEGFTAFDLYNSTVEGAAFDRFSVPYHRGDEFETDLLTWGGNRWVTHVTHDDD